MRAPPCRAVCARVLLAMLRAARARRLCLAAARAPPRPRWQAVGATVTFESIDGPPPQVFDRMVSVLEHESKLRNLSMVLREGAASYRMRSYLSAQVSRGRTTIAGSGRR